MLLSSYLLDGWMEVAGFPQCLVILHFLYSSVKTQLGFPLPGLGGRLQSGERGRLHIGAVGGEWSSEQAGAGLNGSSSTSQACSAASSSLPACSVSFEGRFPASLQWGGCAGVQGEYQVCTQFLSFSPFPLPPHPPWLKEGVFHLVCTPPSAQVMCSWVWLSPDFFLLVFKIFFYWETCHI